VNILEIIPYFRKYSLPREGSYRPMYFGEKYEKLNWKKGILKEKEKTKDKVEVQVKSGTNP
jgi:hypothetical protein